MAMHGLRILIVKGPFVCSFLASQGSQGGKFGQSNRATSPKFTLGQGAISKKVAKDRDEGRSMAGVVEEPTSGNAAIGKNDPMLIPDARLGRGR